jgi:hypothetical protein
LAVFVLSGQQLMLVQNAKNFTVFFEAVFQGRLLLRNSKSKHCKMKGNLGSGQFKFCALCAPGG